MYPGTTTRNQSGGGIADAALEATACIKDQFFQFRKQEAAQDIDGADEFKARLEV